MSSSSRKRAAPVAFDEPEGRTFQQQLVGAPSGVTIFNEAAFVRFNYVDEAAAARRAAAANPHNNKNQGFMCRLGGIMLSTITAGFTGLGRKISGWLYDPSYQVAERTAFDPRNGNWSNKRGKILCIREHVDDPEPPVNKRGPNPRWCNDDEEIMDVCDVGRLYRAQFELLKKYLCRYAWHDTDSLRVNDIIEQLKHLKTGLFDHEDEVGDRGDHSDNTKTDHYTKLLQVLSTVTTFLDILYEFEWIRGIRQKNGWEIHHDYWHTSIDFPDEAFVEYGTTTMKLFTDPHFLAIITYLYRILPIPAERQVTKGTIKNILIDMFAIENNLPPLTYVEPAEARQTYLFEIARRYGRPQWMDLPDMMSDDPLATVQLPGRFPEEPQHSRLRASMFGGWQGVPHVTVMPIPPPLVSRSGRGELVSLDKDPPEPIWKALNSGRICKREPARKDRCKICKNMPYKCTYYGCHGWKNNRPRTYFLKKTLDYEAIQERTRKAKQPKTPTQSPDQAPLRILPSPLQLHSPHHHHAPVPPGIIKRSDRDPITIATHPSDLDRLQIEPSSPELNSPDNTINPPDLDRLQIEHSSPRQGRTELSPPDLDLSEPNAPQSTSLAPSHAETSPAAQSPPELSPAETSPPESTPLEPSPPAPYFSSVFGPRLGPRRPWKWDFPMATNLEEFFAEDEKVSLVSREAADYISGLQARRRAEIEAREAAERAEIEAQEAVEREEALARNRGLRPPKQQLVEILSDQDIQSIQSTLRAAPSTILARTGEGVELIRRDFEKVVPPTEWLNDEIVNGALNGLEKTILAANGIKNVRTQTPTCVTFSSFFFKMLEERGPANGVRGASRKGVKKTNFFDIDTLLLPICKNSHWTLLVIRPSRKTVAHMDSLNPRGNSSFVALAYQWLKEILQDDFVEQDWETVLHEAPRQVNGWDCGVHVITNAMCLALGLHPIDSYLASDMPMQRLRVAGMLLNGGYQGDYGLEAF